MKYLLLCIFLCKAFSIQAQLVSETITTTYPDGTTKISKRDYSSQGITSPPLNNRGVLIPNRRESFHTREGTENSLRRDIIDGLGIITSAVIFNNLSPEVQRLYFLFNGNRNFQAGYYPIGSFYIHQGYLYRRPNRNRSRSFNVNYNNSYNSFYRGLNQQLRNRPLY